MLSTSNETRAVLEETISKLEMQNEAMREALQNSLLLPNLRRQADAAEVYDEEAIDRLHKVMESIKAALALAEEAHAMRRI